jgi:peptide/nickel transport system permease protein
VAWLILRRIGVFAATLVVASVVVFGVMAVLPGDPAVVALGVNADPQLLEQTREEFGTDRPLVEQYASWAGGLVQGDFGRSYVTDAAIGPLIADRMLVTLWLVGLGVLVAVLVAAPLGVASAVWHRKARGTALAAVSQAGMAVPAFVLAILLVSLFAVKLQWVESSGWVPPAEDPVAFLRQIALPVLSLGLVQAALLSRYVRSATLDVLREDYLRTARAKGLSPARALWRHGVRNASIPVVTVLGLQVAALLVDAIIIEVIFVIPGLGSLLLEAVSNRDLLTVQGVVMVIVAAVLLINLLVDALYVAIDPRLRRSA